MNEERSKQLGVNLLKGGIGLMGLGLILTFGIPIVIVLGLLVVAGISALVGM